MNKSHSIPKNELLIISEIKNLTSELNLLSQKNKIEVLECNGNGILINSSNLKCSLGHLISIKGKLQTSQDEHIEFTSIGKIVEIETDSNGLQKITVKFNQFDKNLWNSFIEFLSKTQNRVDQLLVAIKGED